jgi:hypothetical protein
MASAPASSPSAPIGSVLGIASNPALVLPGSNRFFETVRATPDGKFLWVRLTASGNEALRLLCHTAIQREVWTWPSYEFQVKLRPTDNKPYISVDKVCSLLILYTTYILINLIR